MKINEVIPTYVAGDNLFANYYPDDPNNIVSVIALGGSPPPKYNTNRELTFEIKIRNDTYNDGNDIGNQIMDIFHSKENYSLGSIFILHSYATTDISYLYADSKNRDEFSLEMAFIIQK